MFGLLCLAGLLVCTLAGDRHQNSSPSDRPAHDSRPTDHDHDHERVQLQPVHGRPTTARVSQCRELCFLLHNKCPDHVCFPNSTAYDAGQQYWSRQQAVTTPTCRFMPNCAEQVSDAMVDIKTLRCPFAVKSGGHGAFQGASNIPEGITIDLSALNDLQVDHDNKITRTGTGNRWEDVYAKLDEMHLAVIGGRNGDIGVGGLTLGGGISFFSGSHGWACDNVANYQVVLANGSIVHANPTTNPNLYFALRGGGNNFGIVTRMDLETFPQGPMWGGTVFYPRSANRSIINAFYWFNRNAAMDPRAHNYVAAVCFTGAECGIANGYAYSQPVANAPIFDNFTKIPYTTSTARISTLSNFTAELKASQPPGFYQAFWTLTVQNDESLLADILNDIFYPAILPYVNTTENFVGTLAMQPITEAIIQNFGKNGGNALGVNGSQGPLVILNMDWQWSDPSAGPNILATQRRIIDESRQLAERRGLGHPFLYQNYAYGSQDVFAGYGGENRDRLEQVQRDYDPDGVFTDLQPGYFKLRLRGGELSTGPGLW
ncbi:bifunctional solanapyrone synthase-like [Lecanosticta acicola]|uniref:Bifunctional solanapyrone synthase-like n=1 Tax=Lecanosticta acicola TaxID=111012 RepID=A0AAI8Z872_9PEZI|nr:bifunctional solanapyrone synthase-like [Lecanosticta acicola]